MAGANRLVKTMLEKPYLITLGLAGILVVAAGLVLIVWLVVIPAWTGVSELRKEVSLKKKESEKNSRKIPF